MWRVFLFATAAACAASPDFKRDIAPLLENRCLACHSAAKAAGGLSVQTRKSIRHAITPGEPETSALLARASLASTEVGAMPPGGPRLSDAELGLVSRWIAAGAEWPDGVTLAPASKPVKLDEHETVRQIRERIAKGSTARSGRYAVTIPNSTVRYEMVPIQAGSFTMGSPVKPDEQPMHPVRVDAFWMQAHEVTWDEYRLFMFSHQVGKVVSGDELVDAVAGPTRPYVEMSFGMGINGYPAISMTQHAANKYAEWLSAKTGEFYRLPTEAEWEYACRAGGPQPAPLDNYAWFAANSNGKYERAAAKKPNPWGLYDMLGNVMEWTLDAYAPYAAGAAENPWVRATTPYPHAARGGSWNDPAEQVRCSARIASDASWKQQDPQLPKSIWYLTDAQWLGFRLVRPARLPSADEMYRAWNNGVEHDEQ